MKIKRVKSKSGKIYEYDASRYKYTHRSTRGLTLVGKNGRVYEKNIEKLKKAIDANPNYQDTQKRYLKADLDAYVSLRKRNAERLTSSGFFGKQKSDSIDRMFTNAGYSMDEVAAQYGIDVDELSDPDNWNGNELIVGGKKYIFNFTYTGDILTEEK